MGSDQDEDGDDDQRTPQRQIAIDFGAEFAQPVDSPLLTIDNCRQSISFMPASIAISITQLQMSATLMTTSSRGTAMMGKNQKNMALLIQIQ